MGFKAATAHFLLVIAVFLCFLIQKHPQSCTYLQAHAHTHVRTYIYVHAVHLIEEKVVQRDGEGRCVHMRRRAESGALRDEPFDT